MTWSHTNVKENVIEKKMYRLPFYPPPYDTDTDTHTHTHTHTQTHTHTNTHTQGQQERAQKLHTDRSGSISTEIQCTSEGQKGLSHSLPQLSDLHTWSPWSGTVKLLRFTGLKEPPLLVMGLFFPFDLRSTLSLQLAWITACQQKQEGYHLLSMPLFQSRPSEFKKYKQRWPTLGHSRHAIRNLWLQRYTVHMNKTG